MTQLMFGGGWLEPLEFSHWRQRVKLERQAGNIPPAQRDALWELLTFHGEEGLWPSDKAVAERACVSISTVRRARKTARELGMLRWEPTRKLVAGAWRQGPNRYQILVPETPVCPGVQKERRRDSRYKGRLPVDIFDPVGKSPKRQMRRPSYEERVQAKAALIRVAVQRDAALMQRWLTRAG